MVLLEINSQKPVYVILNHFDRCVTDTNGFVSSFLDLVMDVQHQLCLKDSDCRKLEWLGRREEGPRLLGG